MSNETKQATLAWRGDMRFEGGEAGKPAVLLDGNGVAGPSPMTALLLAAAGCTGADIVSIVGKMRQPLASLRIEVSGTRREEEPRRYTEIRLHYHASGDGLDEAKLRRAVDLSLTKYCSVLHSLAPDIRVAYDLTLG